LEQKSFAGRDRRSFMAGVIAGFEKKLREEKSTQKSQGIIWVKDGALTDFFGRRHPRLRHVAVRSSGSAHAFSEGFRAGKAIEMHRPMPQGARGPRLLGRGN
jgi:hypothetical protein